MIKHSQKVFKLLSRRPMPLAVSAFNNLPRAQFTPITHFTQLASFSTKIGSQAVVEMQVDEDWETYLDSDIPIVLQAGANWCGPCKMLKPMMTIVAEELIGKVQYVYMDIDKFPDIATMLEIQHIPKTFLVYKGDLVDSFGGVP